jgi:hypothetical protein
MKRSTSGFFLVLAVLNLIVAVIPPVAGVVGVVGMMRDSDIVVNGKQVGPEFDRLVAKEAPLAKIESFGALGANAFSCLLLIAGSIGLFMGYGWGRWATVAGAVFMVLGLVVHDVYQIFFYRPALETVFNRIAEPFQNLPGDEFQRNILRTTLASLRWGMTIYACAWSCSNPLIMLYLFVMSMCMAFMTGFHDVSTISLDKRRTKDDDDEEDDDEDHRRARRRKKWDRGED